MIKKSFKRILKRYQTGQLDQNASLFIERWYDRIAEEETKDLLQDEEKANLIRNSIHSNLLKHIKPESTKRRLTPWYYSAAACLAIVCGILIAQKLNNRPLSPLVYVTVKTEPGILKKIELPDHSAIWLNSGSTIRYNALTFKKKRQVFLDEGEAFFTVVKDAKHPFSVHTSTLNTTVLGTSFNVKDYQKLNYTSVQVKTGRVKVKTSSNKLTAIITADQSITYDKISGEIHKSLSVVPESDSWTEGTVVLKEATFDELSLLIYNRYQVKLKSTIPAIGKYRYTINIYQNQSMKEILNLICAIHKNKYRRNKNEVNIY